MVHPNGPDYVGIEFKVWAPQLTRVTKKLYLLGSLKELGAWNIDKALKAFPTEDMHVWTVETSLPAMSHFEWVWLTTSLNRGDVRWERSVKRNRTIDCFSGTIHTIWGEGDEVFLQSATCLEVTTFIRVDEGFTLVLTGSTPSVGEWNLHYAKPATEFPKRSGYWKINLSFDALTNLEFKWAVVKEKDHGVLRTQEKLPHSIFGRRSWMRAVAPWNVPIVVVVDTPLLCDLPDTMRGRTDVIVKARKRRAEEIKTWLLQADSEKAASVKVSQKVPPTLEERQSSVTSLSMDTPVVAVASGMMPTPTFSNITMLARQKTPDLDEVKGGEDIQKNEKMIKATYKKYNEESIVHAIKGRGQRIVPTDKMNIGDFQLEECEESSKIYGEVAEITAMHVPVCVSIGKHKPKYVSSVDRPDMRESHKCLAHSYNNRSLTKVLKAEETPLLIDVECTTMKGLACDEDGGSVTHEGIPGPVVSQTVPETMPSDTGFTEMSSWVSSAKTDATNSESALTSSHTLTYVLAAEANNVSDGEDSRSDPGVSGPVKCHRLNEESAMSYWELQQPDLTPPWLHKKYDLFQGGGDDMVADNITAWEDDKEHVEWMASRIEKEEEGEESNYANFRPDFEDSSDCSAPESKTITCEHETEAFSSSSDQKKRLASSPPKSLRENWSPRRFIQFKEEESTADENVEARTSPFCDYVHISDNSASSSPFSIDINSEDDDEELAQRRLIARSLEEQWGASYKATEGLPVNSVQSNHPCWTDFDKSSALRAVNEGFGGLISLEGKTCRMAYYSLDELSDMTLPESDFTNHREKAHEIERLWGESQNKALPVK